MNEILLHYFDTWMEATVRRRETLDEFELRYTVFDTNLDEAPTIALIQGADSTDYGSESLLGTERRLKEQSGLTILGWRTLERCSSCGPRWQSSTQIEGNLSCTLLTVGLETFQIAKVDDRYSQDLKR